MLREAVSWYVMREHGRQVRISILDWKHGIIMHNLCAICSVRAFFQAASAAAQAIARKMAKKQAPSAWATEEDETLDYCRMLWTGVKICKVQSRICRLLCFIILRRTSQWIPRNPGLEAEIVTKGNLPRTTRNLWTNNLKPPSSPLAETNNNE